LKVLARIKSKAEKKKKKEAALELAKPNEVESDSDSNIDESTGRQKYQFMHMFVQDHMEYFSTKDLYKLYTLKLENEDRKRAKKVDKAPRLVRGFTDYIRTLEDRIGKLETAVMEKAMKKAGEQDEKKDADTSSQDQDTNVRTVFYNYANEPNIDFIDIIANDRWKEKGSFTSEVDQNHFLRVLYKWESEPTDHSDGAKPKSNNIDILAIRLYSKPVAVFLQRIARYQLHKDNLVLMTKPFRLLIQNASAIQDHIRKLQEKYRYVAGGLQ